MSNLGTRRLIWLFIVGVLLNYLWELAQMPLYTGPRDYSTRVLWHCFVASLGDGIMVLLIAGIGRIALRRSDWFLHPGVRGYLVMITAGLVLPTLCNKCGLLTSYHVCYIKKNSAKRAAE